MWVFFVAMMILVFICWTVLVTYNLHTLDKRVQELEALLENLNREIVKNSKEKSQDKTQEENE